MQMPPRPEATSRIVIFRMEEDRMKGYAPALVPVLSVNGESLGEIAGSSLSIRDVAPGDYQIALANAPDIKPLKATLHAGDEWFIETGVKIDDCQGPKMRPIGRTGVAEADLVTGVIDLFRVAHMAANTSCASTLRLEATWPQVSRWRINPLLQKYGTRPEEPTSISDITIPQSDLSWRDVEHVIRVHFSSSTHADKYKAFVDPSGRGSLALKNISLAGESRSAMAESYEVPVVLEYLHIDEDTLAGRYVKRPLRYTLRREGDGIAVTGWKDGL